MWSPQPGFLGPKLCGCAWLRKQQPCVRPLNSFYLLMRASLVPQLVKNLPAVWETWVQSLGWEDPLEKGKATHSSILAWKIPWTVWSMGSQKVGHD